LCSRGVLSQPRSSVGVSAFSLSASRMDEAVRQYMVGLGKLRWERMTDAQKAAHIRRMVAGQRKARKHRQAKARGGK